jgi:hypothetical protein
MNSKNDIRETFDRFRKALNESENNEQRGGVPYTQQDELLQTSMQTAKEQFGADFTKIKTPMFYYKDDGDVTFSGEIPGLNNAAFQFRYKDPSGCGVFFWTKGQIILSDENVKKLQKINGVYKNWKQELATSEDIRPADLRNEQ